MVADGDLKFQTSTTTEESDQTHTPTPGGRTMFSAAKIGRKVSRVPRTAAASQYPELTETASVGYDGC